MVHESGPDGNSGSGFNIRIGNNIINNNDDDDDNDNNNLGRNRKQQQQGFSEEDHHRIKPVTNTRNARGGHEPMVFRVRL